MTEPLRALAFPQPPSGIAIEPLQLDDVLFTPSVGGRIEVATRAGNYIGDVLLDIVDGQEPRNDWFARKLDGFGVLSDWKPMRCVHEARAFIVSLKKQ